ncbi:hypothetical protein V8E52_003487 [Russula decolorans]
MRATLHFSLLAATLSPSLVHSSPIPFTQNYNSSPRSSAQALSETSRPGGVLSSRSLLTHGGSRGYGYGLGILDLGSNNGGDGGDASSGNSPPAHRDHRDDEGKHPADGGGPPAIDLGPITPASDQPQPEPSGDDASPKPGAFNPGEPAPPHDESKSGIDPNVGDGGNKSADVNTPGKIINPETPATAPLKPGPDPEAGKSPPDIPIFLGPSNNTPPPGRSGPSSNAPQSGYPGDEGNIGNGGSGGNSAYSGAGGDASGGSVIAYPALVNILSNNGGDGGYANSGDSFSWWGVSKRHGSASYSGSGGKASGGSVKKPCSSRRAVSQVLTDSGTGNGPTEPGSGGSKLAMQRKWDGRAEAYSGKGGDASGGSVEGGHALINIGSGNGGHGGDASSGTAYANGSGAKAYSGAGGKATGGNVDRRALINIRTGKASDFRFSPQGKYGRVPRDYDGLVDAFSENGGDGGYAQSGNAFAAGYGASAYSGPGGDASGGSVTRGRHGKVGRRDGGGGRESGAEAYTGAGGDASGGDVEGGGGLINLFSGNGGDGGDASSGDAFAYSKGGKAKAYSGHGGDASGGSVKDKKPGYGHGYRSGGLIDVASGNGGDGGDASSGNAVAVSDG